MIRWLRNLFRPRGGYLRDYISEDVSAVIIISPGEYSFDGGETWTRNPFPIHYRSRK
jgi:hypothetical protein